jgi:glutamate synthase (NADPH/NADH) large chain
VVRTPPSSTLESTKNVIIGNVALYGATSGSLFAAGHAGDRFCVRNSGASAVVEGCGANGCEYMTGGTAVILGPVGDNFAAGMTGGMAFVYDPGDLLPARINGEDVIYQRIQASHWDGVVRRLIVEHGRQTQSSFARRLINDWERERGHFWQVVPMEMLERLEAPLAPEQETAAAGDD